MRFIFIKRNNIAVYFNEVEIYLNIKHIIKVKNTQFNNYKNRWTHNFT